MRAYSRSQVTDHELSRNLASHIAEGRVNTAIVLADIAEFDARRLYLPAAYPSMYAYCVGELHLSEESAYKRIRVARTARQFPAIFEYVADGRLHLSGVIVLAAYLTPENAGDLLAAAAHKTRAEIEQLIAQRFPKSEEFGLVLALPTQEQLSPGTVESRDAECSEELVPGRVESHETKLSPGTVGTHARVAPIAQERYEVHFTMGRDMQEELRYVQDLLGHTLPSGNVAEVFRLALGALKEKLERRKFAATTRPRRARASKDPRHIPAEVKRAVWERDGGQCTFVSESGHRCDARKFLEFDHVTEVARGGRASVSGIRLRCRAHNQYAAERTFGAGFMQHKREMAQRAAETRRRESEARREAEARAAAEAQLREARVRAAAQEVITPLRLLGYRAGEARDAAALCEAIPDASLEQRIRLALTYFLPRLGARVRSGATPAQPGP